MIKKFLLASSVISLACATGSAEEIYIIKDGQFVGDSTKFYPSSEPDSVSVVITEGSETPEGSMIKIKNPAKPYKSGYVAFDESVFVDLNKTWMMAVEYYIPTGTELTGKSAKRECLTFDLIGDTKLTFDTKNAAGEDSVIAFANNPKQNEYRVAHVTIDCRMRDFYSYNEAEGTSDLTNHGLGVVREVKKYVYSSEIMPAGLYENGEGNKVKGMFISFFPENEAEVIGYIKSLKFYSEGTKPFFADKFSILTGEGTIHASSTPGYLKSYIADPDGTGDIVAYTSMDATSPRDLYGMAQIISDMDKKARAKLTSDRMYCDLGEQSSVEFFDTEYGFLPYLLTNEAKKERANANVLIRIPVDASYVGNVIEMAIRLGHNAGDTGHKTPYADYRSNSTIAGLPISYRFEKGNPTTISAVTPWTKWTASYEKGGADLVDTIPTLMSMLYGNIDAAPVAEGYNYVTIRLEPNDVISYMFTDLTLTGKAGRTVEKTAPDVFGVEVPFVFTPTDVKNVVAKGAISIYPNPASDVITVANEGVKSVVIYSLAGSVVASSDSNTVNVASLAKGSYIVKAATEDGVVTGQIIKK